MSSLTDKIDQLNLQVWENRFNIEYRNQYLVNLEEAKKLSEEISYLKGQAYSDLNMAIHHFHNGQQKQAHQLILEILPWFQENELEPGYSTSLRYLGNIYYGLGDITAGIDYTTRALKSAEKLDFTEGIGEANNDLGLIYEADGDYEKALMYLNRAKTIKEEAGDLNGAASSINRIARTYSDQGKYKDAIKYYKLSEKIRKEHYPISLPWTYIGMAGTFEKMGEHTLAIQYYQKILLEFEDAIDERIKCYLNLGMGRSYTHTSDNEKALSCYNNSVDLAESIEAKNLLIEAHKALAEFYEKQGDLVNSLKHSKEFVSMLEEFYSAENRTRMKNLQIGYAVETEQREKEIFRLKNVELRSALTEIEKQKDEIEKQRNELSSTLDKLKRTQSQLLESRKMEALAGLVAGMAHEINTPVGIGITAVSSMIDQATKMAELYNEDKISRSRFRDYLSDSMESARLLQKNLDRTASMIQNFKEVSVLHSAEKRQKFYLKSFMQDLAKSMLSQPEYDKIEFELKCDDKLRINTYPGDVARILSNIIQNSQVHAFGPGAPGQIQIVIKLVKRSLSIDYSDNGAGIPPDLLPRIFEPFVTSDQQKGPGLGLHIVYNLVTQKFKGTILCESDRKSGTKFYINIPL